MKDLQELWDEIPVKALYEEDVEAIVSRKSSHELDRFKRLLLIELYITVAAVIALLFAYFLLAKEMTMVIGIAVFLGTLLNVVTLIKLNRLQLNSDIRTFLHEAIKFLHTFIAQYIVLVLVAGVLVIGLLKFAYLPHSSWADWLSSKTGIFLLSLCAVIIGMQAIYANVFYGKRIRALKAFLEEINGL